MTTTTTGAQSHEDYTTSAGLRALLQRLHQAGNRAWEHDPVAASLMSYAADKYAAPARKHHLDPWEAASAAFDVLRTRSAREANDPWGVVTHAVRITCIGEERAQGLLCSTHQARRPHISAFHDAERLSDRETPLSDYHPAFQITDPEPDTDTNGGNDGGSDGGGGQASMSASSAAEDAIALVTMLGWEPATARASVEHICGALARAGAPRLVNRPAPCRRMRASRREVGVVILNLTLVAGELTTWPSRSCPNGLIGLNFSTQHPQSSPPAGSQDHRL